jgi:hypothetical protein
MKQKSEALRICHGFGWAFGDCAVAYVLGR